MEALMLTRVLIRQLYLSLALIVAGTTGCVAPPPTPPPNLVLILADDMEVTLLNDMPQVAQMRRSGTTFTSAYVNTPICAPSRASILTGRYAQNTGVRSNRLPF